jgi:hypothetical protein
MPLPRSYLFPTELVTKVKPNINSVEVHPQWRNNRHPVDGALLGAGSLWPLRRGHYQLRFKILWPNPIKEYVLCASVLYTKYFLGVVYGIAKRRD